MSIKPFISEYGRVSATKIWFSLFSVVVLVKFSLAGMTIGGVTLGEFDAQGAAWLLGALGAIYGGRRATEAFAGKGKGHARPPRG